MYNVETRVNIIPREIDNLGLLYPDRFPNLSHDKLRLYIDPVLLILYGIFFLQCRRESACDLPSDIEIRARHYRLLRKITDSDYYYLILGSCAKYLNARPLQHLSAFATSKRSVLIRVLKIISTGYSYVNKSLT